MKPTINFGPAGLGPVKDTISNLKQFKALGLTACEIAFTYGPYIKDPKDAKKIAQEAKKLGIRLSIHAPYWINLNSKDPEKIEKSKQRILKCCEIGTHLNAYRIVFHPGYYSDISKTQTFLNIKREILNLQQEIKKHNYTPKLAPETTGKVNVFGSIEEIARLVKETDCKFCIDFAHVEAREKKVDYNKIKKLFPQKTWHVHFSGIEYGEKGEKRHLKTQKENWKTLLKNLPKNKDITIINESPYCVEDAVEGLQLSTTI